MFGEDDTSAVFDYTPEPWFKNAVWLLPASGAALLALLATAVLWPGAAIVRRRYGAVFPLQGMPAHAYRLTRVAALASALVMATWLGTIAYMMTAFAFGASMDPVLTALHWLSIVIFPLAVLIAVWNVFVVWTTRGGWGSWFARLWSTVVAVSCMMMLWVGGVFHLIGTGVQY